MKRHLLSDSSCDDDSDVNNSSDNTRNDALSHIPVVLPTESKNFDDSVESSDESSAPKYSMSYEAQRKQTKLSAPAQERSASEFLKNDAGLKKKLKYVGVTEDESLMLKPMTFTKEVEDGLWPISKEWVLNENAQKIAEATKSPLDSQLTLTTPIGRVKDESAPRTPKSPVKAMKVVALKTPKGASQSFETKNALDEPTLRTPKSTKTLKSTNKAEPVTVLAAAPQTPKVASKKFSLINAIDEPALSPKSPVKAKITQSASARTPNAVLKDYSSKNAEDDPAPKTPKSPHRKKVIPAAAPQTPKAASNGTDEELLAMKLKDCDLLLILKEWAAQEAAKSRLNKGHTPETPTECYKHKSAPKTPKSPVKTKKMTSVAPKTPKSASQDFRSNSADEDPTPKPPKSPVKAKKVNAAAPPESPKASANDFTFNSADEVSAPPVSESPVKAKKIMAAEPPQTPKASSKACSLKIANDVASPDTPKSPSKPKTVKDATAKSTSKNLTSGGAKDKPVSKIAKSPVKTKTLTNAAPKTSKTASETSASRSVTDEPAPTTPKSLGKVKKKPASSKESVKAVSGGGKPKKSTTEDLPISSCKKKGKGKRTPKKAKNLEKDDTKEKALVEKEASTENAEVETKKDSREPRKVLKGDGNADMVTTRNVKPKTPKTEENADQRDIIIDSSGSNDTQTKAMRDLEKYRAQGTEDQVALGDEASGSKNDPVAKSSSKGGLFNSLSCSNYAEPRATSKGSKLGTPKTPLEASDSNSTSSSDSSPKRRLHATSKRSAKSPNSFEGSESSEKPHETIKMSRQHETEQQLPLGDNASGAKHKPVQKKSLSRSLSDSSSSSDDDEPLTISNGNKLTPSPARLSTSFSASSDSDSSSSTDASRKRRFEAPTRRSPKNRHRGTNSETDENLYADVWIKLNPRDDIVTLEMLAEQKELEGGAVDPPPECSPSPELPDTLGQDGETASSLTTTIPKCGFNLETSGTVQIDSVSGAEQPSNRRSVNNEDDNSDSDSDSYPGADLCSNYAEQRRALASRRPQPSRMNSKSLENVMCLKDRIKFLAGADKQNHIVRAGSPAKKVASPLKLPNEVEEKPAPLKREASASLQNVGSLKDRMESLSIDMNNKKNSSSPGKRYGFQRKGESNDIVLDQAQRGKNEEMPIQNCTDSETQQREQDSRAGFDELKKRAMHVENHVSSSNHHTIGVGDNGAPKWQRRTSLESTDVSEIQFVRNQGRQPISSAYVAALVSPQKRLATVKSISKPYFTGAAVTRTGTLVKRESAESKPNVRESFCGEQADPLKNVLLSKPPLTRQVSYSLANVSSLKDRMQLLFAAPADGQK